MLTRESVEWHTALDAFLLERAQQPFAWGINDCCRFAAAWVQLVRGTDPMAGLIYDDARGAAFILRSDDGLLAAIAERMGDPVPGAMARRGDVALVRHAGARPSVGVCTGPEIAAPGDAGMVLLPITAAEAAWRV